MSGFLERLKPGRGKKVVPRASEHAGGIELAIPSKETLVTGVRSSEFLSGIPLPNWDSVRATLYLYASGKIEESKGTRAFNLKAYSDAYGVDEGMRRFSRNAPAEFGGEFVDVMLSEAHPRIEERGQWRRSYDYDGYGVFHKTSIEIEKLPQGEPAEYALGISAAYVGEKPEIALAEALGVERATRRKNVTIEYAPQNDQFRIDMDDVASRLGTVPATTGKDRRGRITGKAIADHFMSRDRYGHPISEAFVLGERDGFRISLRFGRVGEHIDSQVDRKKELWQRSGNMLQGGLAKEYSDKTKSVPPSLVVSVVDARSKSYQNFPVVSPEKLATMQAISERIAAVFQPKAA
ncbi:MAG TPA: hypothetical protein VKT82_28895 [Ktedonobacterales bacterium]|nr:hypothetical protein [Ktedonobacterales bacterium]